MLQTIKNICIRFSLLCFVSVLLGASIDARASRDITYIKTKIAGVHINLITTNLNNANMFVTPALSKCGIGSCESFRSILRRTRPAAAINGTFFCTRTLKPTGDIVIDGQLLWKGFLGTAITVGYNGQIQFLSTRRRSSYIWSDYAQVMAAGPTLVLRGKTIVMPRTEGFRSGVHFSRRARAAVGLTYKNKLVFVTTRQHIYYRQLATVMKRLKCVDAAVLDGGSSIGLYYKGKLINNPGRAMTNCLLIYDNRDAYERHKALLYPTNRVAKLPIFK